ncbi:unnamed protein product [Pylaiella littoralis]
MARLHAPKPLASIMVLALLLPPEVAVAFVPNAPPSSASSSLRGRQVVPSSAVQQIERGIGGSGGGETSAGTGGVRSAGGGAVRRRRLGPQPLLASSKPGVKDTTSIISEMEGWANVVTCDTPITRNTKYIVSEGTSLPEVFFDFWKAVSAAIDGHRATSEARPFRKTIMFVAPFCQELRDYETMERAHQLLQQSARDGGCEDFGKAITHSHYHPKYRHRPKPKQSRMASRHSPHPAFSIDVVYRRGGLKSLASIRAASKAAAAGKGGGARGKPSSPSRLRANASAEQKKSQIARKKREEWARRTRTSLEHTYGMAASYGREDAEASGTSIWAHQHALAGRGVPESSQEVMHATQEWLKGVLKAAAESDAEAATIFKAAATGRDDEDKPSPPATTATIPTTTTTTTTAAVAASPSSPGAPSAAATAAHVLSARNGESLLSQAGAPHGGGLDTDRSAALNPATAAAAEAIAAAPSEEQEAAARGITIDGTFNVPQVSIGSNVYLKPRAGNDDNNNNSNNNGNDHDHDHDHAGQSTQPRHHTPSVRFRAATTSVAGGLRQAFAHAAELVTVHREDAPPRAVSISSSTTSTSNSAQQRQHMKEGVDGGGDEAPASVGQKRQRQRQQQQQEEASTARVVDAGVGNREEEESPPGGAPRLLPGKELVKRMKDVSQYIVARSKTAEEAYSDVYEVIMEMADRAASRGCSVPTEDYSSASTPCYGALVVTPDLATYSSDTFFRFQETINRGLKHLPMRHDISVEAFHPEAVSEATSLDHRFTRSPFPTLHLCYHGLREKDTALHPRAGGRGKKRSASARAGAGSRKKLSKSSSTRPCRDSSRSERSKSSGEGDDAGGAGGAADASGADAAADDAAARGKEGEEGNHRC